VGGNFLTLCSERSGNCSNYLGDFPMDLAEVLMQQLDIGKLPCGELLNITSDVARTSFGNFIMIESQRVLMPPLMMRLNRCDPTIDVPVLKYMLSIPTPPVTQNVTMIGNPIVNANIGTSELYTNFDPPRSLEEQFTLDASLVVSANTQIQMGNAYSIWPRYPPDQYQNQFFNTTIPILLIEGELDPQTDHGWGVHASTHLSGPAQIFVSVPYAPHGTIFFSPATNSANISCGIQIMTSFFLSNGLKPDKSCLTQLIPPDFDGVTPTTIALSELFFNLTNMWQS